MKCRLNVYIGTKLQKMSPNNSVQNDEKHVAQGCTSVQNDEKCRRKVYISTKRRKNSSKGIHRHFKSSMEASTNMELCYFKVLQIQLSTQNRKFLIPILIPIFL